MSITYTWELPRDSTAPGQGRWRMRELLADNVEAIDAELVITELITNAWKHGTGSDPITVSAELFDDALHVEVCGASDHDPELRAEVGASDGRGLLLIDGLVQEWGFDRRGGVVCVWARVSLH